MSKVNASAAAVKLARENKLDLGEVTATGRGGQITKPDVEKYIAAQNEKAGKGDSSADTADQGADDASTDTTPAAGDGGAEDEAAAAAKARAEEAADEAKSKKGKETREIVKARDDVTSVWWCPFCDNSQPGEHTRCGGCGATRKGSAVAELGDVVTLG